MGEPGAGVFGAGAVIRASFGARGRTGVPVSCAIARAGGAARAYRGGAVRAPDCPREAAGRRPLRKCHEMSCDVMETCCSLFLFCTVRGGSGFCAMRCIRARSEAFRDGPLPGFGQRPPACGRFRRWGGAEVGCGHSCLLQGKGRDEVSLFCARFACAGVRGRGRAYRGGAVRAPDCPRETPDAPRPSVPAGVFFAAPAIAFCRNAERRPRKPPLSTFILSHFASGQAPSGTKNENAGDFPWNASGNEDRKGALCPDALRVTLSPCHAPFGRIRAGSFVAPAPEPGPIPVSPRHRSRWRAGSTAETAARTEAGPRIGGRGDGGGGAAMVQTG